VSALSVLVVDDEAPARRRLVRLLGRVRDVEVVGEAADGSQAVERIRALSPDLVFLDIAMPGMSGLEVAARAGLPPIVFTTAHEQHAIEAFDLAAVDYLLKPIEPERLGRAIERVRERRDRLSPDRLGQLLRAAGQAPLYRIAAQRGSTVRLLDPEEVTRLSSSDKYTVARVGGEELLIDESLSTLEQRLERYRFMRVHRAELVNLRHVVALASGRGEAYVELSDGQRAAVSRRLLPELRERLGLT
jgi:DNA-binding LytR/AlgR family response regulator